MKRTANITKNINIPKEKGELYEQLITPHVSSLYGKTPFKRYLNGV